MSDDLVVVARNPAEMQTAQTQLIAWADRKMTDSKNELTSAEENLTAAKKNKWRTSGFQTHVRKARERFEYYEKIKAALEAGYVIVPNFDLDIFAIRTTKQKPRQVTIRNKWRRPTPDQFENKTDRPKLGEGENRDPWPELSHRILKTDDGEKPYYLARTEGWNAVDFPFKLSKPQILDDTAKALARKIFDRIGVTPHRTVRKRDPMIIGQICYGTGDTQKQVSFLVTWWLQESDLEV